MDKPALIKKIKALDSLTNAEKSDLIDLLNNTKKYGLVWEDKPEDVERDLLTMLPVLQEVPERRILAKDLIQIPSQTENPKSSDPTLFNQTDTEIAADSIAITGDDDVIEDSKNATPNHILIEGDKLHAITSLSFTHEGKIDVIYIDPPYNTGNKDFKYNDSFVDKEDTYRHSKWLSFIHKRLVVAKRLMSDKGVLFISIDDNEQSQLKMLCDEVFGEINFVGNIIWRSSDNSNNDAKQFSSDHNYTLVYSKLPNWLTKKIDRTTEQKQHYKNPDNDPRGPWFDGNPISSPNPRTNLCYEIIAPNGNIIKPPQNGWRWSKETLAEKMQSGEIFFNKSYTNIKRKTYLLEQKGLPPSSLWVDLEQTGHNRQAKYELQKIFPEKTKLEVFTTPKPVKLIRRIFDASIENNSTVLDFFAGSGTTLQALIELNAEDGGTRQCILVTNNENNICEEVTYQRNKRVICGYISANGAQVPGFSKNNFRYYKTIFVPSAKTEVNRRLLTRASTELLQIKEDCYNDITTANGLDPAKCCICANETGKYLVVVFHSRQQSEVIGKLCDFIRNISDLSEKVRVYAFSPETETLAEDFYPVADKINAVPLPDAIYNAYRATFKSLKLEKKVFSPQSPVTAAEQGAESENSGQSDLFEKEEE